MEKYVIVTVSDFNNLDNVISLRININETNPNSIDFVTIIPQNEFDLLTKNQLKILNDADITLLPVPLLESNPPIHWYKLYIFDNFFKKYDWIFYTDIDVIFFKPINFENLRKRNKSKLYANKDKMKFMNHFKGYKNEKKLSSYQKGEIQKLRNKYKNKKSFQSCFMFFHRNLIEENIKDKLIDLFTIYHLQKNLSHAPWWDQSILNLFFYQRWEDLGEEYVNVWSAIYKDDWRLDIPYYDNDDYRNHICLHFSHHLPPWSDKNLRYYPIWKKNYQKVLNNSPFKSIF